MRSNFMIENALKEADLWKFEDFEDSSQLLTIQKYQKMSRFFLKEPRSNSAQWDLENKKSNLNFTLAYTLMVAYVRVCVRT